MKNSFMQKAIALSLESVEEHQGGPFGAVIVKDGQIIAEGYNQVTATHDPTAHAEVVAIRKACQKLGVFHLQGCEIYTSCEPCPMCLAAIYWANLDKIYYANNKVDAAKINFADDFIYQELDRPVAQRKLAMTQMMRDEALVAFEKWSKKTDKIPY